MQNGRKGAEHFMAKWIAAEKVRAGLRHAILCPNVAGRTKERIAPKASGLVLVHSPLLSSHKWRELVSSRRLVCRCPDVFLWCHLCFVLLRFRPCASVEAAALRSIVFRYAGAPIARRVSFFLLFIWKCRLFRVFVLYHCRFLFVWRVRRTFFPSGWCFFYLVTTSWIFEISLCENSINQSINQY